MPQISNLKVNPYAFTATHFRQGALRTINSTRLLKLLERVLSYLGQPIIRNSRINLLFLSSIWYGHTYTSEYYAKWSHKSLKNQNFHQQESLPLGSQFTYLHLKFGRRQRHFPGGQLEVKIYVRISEVPHLATLRYNFNSKQNSLRSQSTPKGVLSSVSPVRRCRASILSSPIPSDLYLRRCCDAGKTSAHFLIGAAVPKSQCGTCSSSQFVLTHVYA